MADTQKDKTYTLKLRCRNCGNVFEYAFPFGFDAEQKGGGGDTRVVSPIEGERWVSCPNCGSFKLLKEFGD